MAEETSPRDHATSQSDAGVMRRGLLRFGTLLTAFTGASAISAIGASSAEAAAGDKNPPTAYIPLSEKGAAQGVATLDRESKIPPALLPDLSAAFATMAPKPTGVAATDIANVQSLLNSLETFGGGEVRLHGGDYEMYIDIPKLCAITGASEGATVIRLPNGANRNVIQSKGFVVFDAAKNTMSTLDGVPHGVRIENVRIDGNRANNTSGGGVALWAIRSTIRNVYIRNCKGRGFYSNGVDGTTGGGADGQVENLIENVWINGCGGVGFGYYGPHDGYGDKIFVYGDVYGEGLANSAEIGNLDVGYMHVYGGRIGVVLKGNARIDHLQTENSMREGLVSESNGSQTNSIRRLTAYANWTSGPSATDYSVRIENRIDVGDAMIRCDHGENGLLIRGANAAGTTLTATITGTGAANRHGLSIVADRVHVNAIIDLFSIGWQRYSNNSIFNIRAQNTSFAGYYEPDATGSGNTINFTFRATAAQHIPWALPATLAANVYNLSSTGATTWRFNWHGQNDAALTNGEVTNRRPTSSSVALISGTLHLTYFTANRNTPVSTVEMNTGGVAAGATPTLCRLGIYSVGPNGDLALVASTANDTTLFGSTFATAVKQLTAPWAPAPGQRYAFGVLMVSVAALPQFYGDANLPGGGAAKGPRLTGQVAGLADLPVMVPARSVATSSTALYAAIV